MSGVISRVGERAINLLVAVAPGAARIAGSALVFVLAAAQPSVGMLPGRIDPKLVTPYVQQTVQGTQTDLLAKASALAGNVEPTSSCSMVWNQTPVIARAAVLAACQRTGADYGAASKIVARLIARAEGPNGIGLPPVSPRRPLPSINVPAQFDGACMGSSVGTSALRLLC